MGKQQIRAELRVVLGAAAEEEIDPIRRAQMQASPVSRKLQSRAEKIAAAAFSSWGGCGRRAAPARTRMIAPPGRRWPGAWAAATPQRDPGEIAEAEQARGNAPPVVALCGATVELARKLAASRGLLSCAPAFHLDVLEVHSSEEAAAFLVPRFPHPTTLVRHSGGDAGAFGLCKRMVAAVGALC